MQVGRILEVDRAADGAAQLMLRAPQRRQRLLDAPAAQRHHEGGGVAQVGRDLHLRHGDRRAHQPRLMRLAAQQRVGQGAADLFADLQLPLRRPFFLPAHGSLSQRPPQRERSISSVVKISMTSPSRMSS